MIPTIRGQISKLLMYIRISTLTNKRIFITSPTRCQLESNIVFNRRNKSFEFHTTRVPLEVFTIQIPMAVPGYIRRNSISKTRAHTVDENTGIEITKHSPRYEFLRLLNSTRARTYCTVVHAIASACLSLQPRNNLSLTSWYIARYPGPSSQHLVDRAVTRRHKRR